VRVSLANSGRAFSVESGESVLAAALRAGLNLPHGCRGGQCGACRARLISGDSSHARGSPLGLAPADAAAGYVLLCQLRAHGDLVIDAAPVAAAGEASIKRLPCRVERTVAFGHDLLGVFLRLPAAEPFGFEPGQSIDFLLAGARRRRFAIASPPHDSRPLELHVRRVVGDEFTDRLFSPQARGTLLSIEGPRGDFRYRPAGATARPMLLIGGGGGFAPLNCIIRHVVENGLGRDMHLYWGVRAEGDLYAHAALEALCRRAPNLRYTPVLSEPGPAWRGRRGWVHEAVLGDAVRLQECEVYASGPPAMIAAVTTSFAARGVAAEHLCVDSSDYAPDTAERQRTTAATKS
jgi:CDP-4-dehydro-6-deoxyglucose reductase